MKFEFSAGGIVYMQVDSGQISILIVKHARYGHWAFPKGHIGDTIKGEKKVDAAVREVKEETGIDAVIREPIKPIQYWYSLDGEKRKKTVYYFVMEYQGGDFTDRDHEMEKVEWVSFEDVENKLTYISEKNAFTEAKDIITRLCN